MSGYSEAIRAWDSASWVEVRVSSLAALLVPSMAAMVFAVTLLHVLFLSQGTRTLFRDSDTGWHIRNGEAILGSAAVPRADSFSYTHAGREWFAWEWLSDVLLGGAHRAAGLAGVALLAALVIALTAGGAAKLALSLGGNLFLTAAATGFLLGTTSIHWLARPHVFSWLVALAFLAVAEHERRSPSSEASAQEGPSRALYWLPALACLWANLHGSFLLGPAILFLYALGEWLKGLHKDTGFTSGSNSSGHDFSRAGSGTNLLNFLAASAAEGHTSGAEAHGKGGVLSAWLKPCPDDSPRQGLEQRGSERFAAACLVSLVATFANPYGWNLHRHVIAYLQNTYLMDHIAEFRSLNFHAPGAIYIELFLLVAVLGAVALVRQRAYGPAMLALALLHLSLYSARHVPTAAVLLLPLCVAALTREAENWPRLRPLLDYSERLRAIDRKVLGVVPVAVVLAAAIAGVSVSARADRVGFDPARFPARAADFLEQRGLDHRVFTKDQWGGYLLYRFQGRMKVFADGRSDFYGQDFLETYATVVEVRPGWDAVLRQYGVRFVLAPPDQALVSALSLSTGWKRVYTDSVAAVFERIG